MSENALNRMTADAALTRDLNQPDLTFDEMKRLLHNAVERSPDLGLARDPETGQFVRRDPLTPAAQDAAAKDAADAAPREFKKTERIGKFTGAAFVNPSHEPIKVIDTEDRTAEEWRPSPEELIGTKDNSWK